jgi:translation initiation factor 3 subunit A
MRLTTLLGLSTSPTRASLLSSTLAAGVLKLAPKPIQRLYEVLEVPFDPLALCGEVAPILAELAAHEGKQGEWAPYVAALQRAVLSRLMSQLAQVYASVRIAFVLELVAPLRTEASSEQKQDVTPQAAVHFFDPEQVESYMMGCARRGELAVRVDHAEGSIAFVDEAFGGVLEGSTFASSSSSSSAGADAAIQPSTTELVRTRLGSVARCLHIAVEAISLPPPLLRGRRGAAKRRPQGRSPLPCTPSGGASCCPSLRCARRRRTPCGARRPRGARRTRRTSVSGRRGLLREEYQGNDVEGS